MNGQHGNKERIDKLWSELMERLYEKPPAELKKETSRVLGIWRYLYEQLILMGEKKNYSYTGKLFSVEVAYNMTIVRMHHHLSNQVKAFERGFGSIEWLDDGLRNFAQIYNLQFKIESIRAVVEYGRIYHFSLHD